MEEEVLKLDTFVRKKSWKIYRTSPLYHFQNDYSTLQKYAKQLGEYLLAENLPLQKLANPKSKLYSSFFLVENGIKERDDNNDAPKRRKLQNEKYSIGITITLFDQRCEDEENIEDTLFMAMFSSLGSTAFDSMNNSKQFTSYPLFLVKKSGTLNEIVFKWLQMKVCKVEQLELRAFLF
jgi:hypothetical protein